MRLRRYSRTLGRHIYPFDQPLSATLPARPAALRLYTDRGVAWSIALDFDVKGHSAATVATHAQDAARFFAQLGGRIILDVAESGGHHLWVPLATPMTLGQAQQLAHGCRQLWPTLDITPTANTGEGCLTAPGSRCKDGKYRTLLTPLADAIQAVTTRSAPDLLARALQLLADLIGPDDQPPTCAPPPGTNRGTPYPLSPMHARIAVHGTYPPDRTDHQGRPWTRSEACYAVVCAAVRRGWSEQDILHQLEAGQWAGLLALYTGRYRHHWRRRVHAEIAKARLFVSTHPTQATQNTGGGGEPDTHRDFARRWLAITLAVADEMAPGRTRHNAQAVLWALAWMAWRTGRRHVQSGTRSYARGCAGLLDHSTAAAILAHLRELPPDRRPIQRRSTGRGTQGDLYELVIPAAYEHLATNPSTWPVPRPIPAVFGVPDPDRPRTRLLGSTGWRLYRALAAGTTGTASDVAHAAGVSRAEAYAILPKLARLGLASNERPATASGCGTTLWQLGTASTHEAGGEVGGPGHLAALDLRHRCERARWRATLASYAQRRTNDPVTSEPDELLWWPPDWDTPPPDSDLQAQALQAPSFADQGQDEAAAVALLTRILGADVIGDTEPVRQTRPPRRWLASEARQRHRCQVPASMTDRRAT